MADQLTNVMAQPSSPAGKPGQVFKLQPKREPQAPPQAPSARTTPSRSPQFQRPNPANNAGRVPRPNGQGERQLDGSRTATFDQPQRKPGLADRLPQSGGGTSGLETAMGALADQLHKHTSRRR